MNREAYSICEGRACLNNEDLTNDARNTSNNNARGSFDISSNNQHISDTDVSNCERNLQMEDSSKRVSSRGRQIISKTEFFGGTAEYNLRQSSIVNRIKSELSRKAPKQPKPKSKPPPLSKYRRRAANARERGRMQEINEAFENLRNLIPDTETIPTSETSTSRRRSSSEDSSNKMTKIMTLRQAMNYISALRELLRDSVDENPEASGVGDISEYPDTSSACSIIGDVSPIFSSDDTDLLVSDSCSDELGVLDSEGEIWRN